MRNPEIIRVFAYVKVDSTRPRVTEAASRVPSGLKYARR
jgi:hypothetical protein